MKGFRPGVRSQKPSIWSRILRVVITRTAAMQPRFKIPEFELTL